MADYQIPDDLMPVNVPAAPPTSTEIPDDLAPVTMPDAVMLHEDTSQNVGVPVGVTSDEANYMAKTQVQGVSKENFWGTTFVPDALATGVDYLKQAGRGFAAFTAETAPKTAGALIQEFGERGASEARGENTASGTVAPGAMDMFLPISPDPDSLVNRTKAAAYQRVADTGKALVAKSQDFVKSLGLEKPKDATTGESVAYDLGSGVGSIGYSIGLTLATRNPLYAAGLFGAVQKGSVYLEGRQKGMNPDDAGNLSTNMGVANGALEALGNGFFIKLGEASGPLRRIAMRMVEEGTQEISQQAVEEVQANYLSSLRDDSALQSLKNVAYAGFLGAAAGGPVSVVVELVTKEAEKQGVPPEQAAAIAQRISANSEEIANTVADELQKADNLVTVDPKLQAEAGAVIKNFAQGKPVNEDVQGYISRRPTTMNAAVEREDTATMALERGAIYEPMTMQERDTTRADGLRQRMAEPIDTTEQVAAGRLRLLDSQVSAMDSQIDQLMATMDERESAGKANVANTNRLTRLLEQRQRLDDQRADILTREDIEPDMVTKVMDEAMGRQQVQVRGDVISRLANRVVSERSRALEAGLREGRRMALTDVTAAQQYIVDTLDASDLTAADKAKFITTVKNIQTPEQALKQLPIIQSRIGRLVELQAQREAKAQIKKLLDKTKVTKQSGKPVGKFTPDLQVMFDEMRSFIKLKGGDAAALLDERLKAYDAPDSVGPTPEDALKNAVLSVVSTEHEINSGQMLDTLDSLGQLVTEGRTEGMERMLERQQRVSALKVDAYQALTGDTVNKFNEFQNGLRMQLIRTGMDPEEAAINAEAARAAYQSFSKRAGDTAALQEVVDNAFQKLVVQGGRGVEGEADTLYQTAVNTQTEGFKTWFGESKAVNPDGMPKVLYHGSQRPDRIAAAGKFDKARATSGPMAFFTDDAAIASNYAKGKTDTSIESFDASDHLTINGIKGDLEKAWNSLPATQRVKIRENAWRVGRNEDTDQIELTEQGLSGKDHFTWVMQREAGNNPLKALYKNWVEGGEIFNEEARFVDVLGVLGVKSSYEDPYAVRSGVLPVYLSVQNPLVTNAIPAEVLISLEEAANAAPVPEQGGFGVDQWDKNFVEPQDWVNELKSDISKGNNSYTWTRIPDWVTAKLKELGYDGVQDIGGKMGGEGHDVWIPFEEGQVKSVFNRGTFDASNPNILEQNNLGLARGSITLGQDGDIIRLFDTANKSTFLHETGHFYWNLLDRMAEEPGAPKSIRNDAMTIRNLVGIGTVGDLSVAQQERIAEDFEVYLETGKAPNAALKRAFAAFKEWLGQIYQSIKGRKTDIDPRMREVFDRWFDGVEPLPATYDRNMIDRTSLGARALAAGRETRANAYGAFNSWQDTINLVFGGDKSGAGDRLLRTLGMDVSALFQKRKGVVRAATERFTNAGMKAFGFTSERQFMNQLAQDTKKVDLGTYFNSAGKEVKFQLSKAEARKRWMEMQDPTLVETIISPNGNAYSPSMVDALENFLTPQDKAFANAQLDFYRWFYPQVNGVYSDYYGVNLPNNPMYSPIAREHHDVNNPMFSQDVAYRRSVAPGSLKNRVATLSPMKDMGDFSVLQRHIGEMAHFMTFANKVQELGGVFGDPRISNVIDDKFGKGITRNIKDYMQDFRVGQIKQLNESINIFEKMRQNFTVAVLGAKPALAIKNFTSFLTYAEFIPAKDFSVGLADFARHPVEAAKILGQSELLKARRKTLDRDIALAYKASEFGAWRGKQTFNNAMLWFTQSGDIASIVAGGWPVYRYNKEVLGKSHEESLKAFEEATALTRSSSDLDQLSRLQSSPSTLSRTATMLMSDTNQLYRREMRAILDGVRGKISKAEAAKRIALYHFVIPMFYQFVADFGEWDKENQLRAALWGSLNGAFIVYDLLNELVKKLQGEKVFSKTNPALQWGTDVANGISKMIENDFETDEFTEGAWKLAGGLGKLAGVPVDRIPQVLQSREDFEYGDTKAGIARILGFPNSVANNVIANDGLDE